MEMDHNVYEIVVVNGSVQSRDIGWFLPFSPVSDPMRTKTKCMGMSWQEQRVHCV